MAHAPHLESTLVSEAGEDLALRNETAAIDASARTPVLVLLGSSVLWLLIASVLGIISTWKLHTPSFLADCSWLTYGRIQPAQTNAFLYGWGVNVSLAITLWMMARLSRGLVRGGTRLLFAAIFWNLGVTLGLLGILGGDSTSLRWLEMPRYATPLLFFAYAFIAAWAIQTFRSGRSETIYVSQWYLFAALFWFPWFYSVAQVMLIFAPVRGTIQSVVNAWYVQSFSGLWFTPIALAVIYYFLPKLLGRPIASYRFASLAFWAVAIFSSFAGAAALLGSPVPAWVQSTGVAATWMLIVPAVLIAINFFGTFAGGPALVKNSPSLKFITVAMIAFPLTALASTILSFRGVAATTQFTFVTTAVSELGLYGTFSMAAFGAIYYLVPRVVGRDWPSPQLITVHFASALIGGALLVFALVLAGFKQGGMINQSTGGFIEAVQAFKPLMLVASVAGVILLLGHIAFALSVAGLLKSSLAMAPVAPSQLKAAVR